MRSTQRLIDKERLKREWREHEAAMGDTREAMAERRALIAEMMGEQSPDEEEENAAE